MYRGWLQDSMLKTLDLGLSLQTLDLGLSLQTLDLGFSLQHGFICCCGCLFIAFKYEMGPQTNIGHTSCCKWK